jgi:hypothetical protein
MIIETSDGQGNIISRIDDGIPADLVMPAPEVIAAQAISDEITTRVESATDFDGLKLAIIDGLSAALVQLQGGQE